MPVDEPEPGFAATRRPDERLARRGDRRREQKHAALQENPPRSVRGTLAPGGSSGRPSGRAGRLRLCSTSPPTRTTASWGTYATPLAPQFADFAGVAAGQRVLDVGCGPGALTAELSRRLGADAVAAVEPVGAVRRRRAGAASRRRRPPGRRRGPAVRRRRVRRRARAARRALHGRPGAGARRDGARDAAGRRRRRVRLGSRRRHRAAEPVLEGGARASTRTRRTSRELAGAREGHLAELFREAGLRDVEDTALAGRASSTRASTTWWEPFTLGVGPARRLPRAARRRAARRAAPRGGARRVPGRPRRHRLGPGPRAAARSAYAAPQ